jgi:uncharacterized repeat protein (TIGR01451 family)
MTPQPPPICASRSLNLNSMMRIGLFIALIALIGIPLFSSSSASSSLSKIKLDISSKNAAQPSSSAPLSQKHEIVGQPQEQMFNHHAASFSLFPVLTPQQGGPESLATYQSNCTTADQSFVTGDTVCAKVTNISPFSRYIYWVNQEGAVVQKSPVSSTNPSSSRQVNEAGIWRVYLVDFDGSSRAVYKFSVSDPQVPQVDLSVIKNSDSNFVAGGFVTYDIIFRNAGPDAAVNARLVESTPNDTTFISATQTSGAVLFNCDPGGGSTTCAAQASFPAGDSATFTFVYQVAAGTATGTIISNRADVASDTLELHAPDNTAMTEHKVSAAAQGGGACTLTCPDDVVTPSNTTDANGNPGAVVHFTPPSGSDECGTVSTNHCNDCFFPDGTTTVTATALTGETCSFTVTVTPANTGGPTITCPANKDVNAPDNACSATVDPGSPATTGTGVTVAGERDDGEPLDAPYPGGVTIITWTATDSEDRTASCRQTITVRTNDTTPPTITAPNDLSLSTGADATSCGLIVGETELGTASASDNCGRVNISRTGVPSGNFFPIGTTTITYTATDGAGNTATDTQTVTITDDSAPTITATAPNDNPPPATVDVPVSNVTVHTGPNSTSCNAVVSDAELGNVQARDNCPNVTLSRTPSGNTFPVGTTTIIWTATDASGNTGTVFQDVTVIDDTQPTITAPADVTAYTGAGRTTCDANVSDATLGSPSANDNCAFTVSRTPSGNTFPVGTTTVTWKVTDASGNTATDTQDVTVVDNTPPVVTCPSNITIDNALGACSGSVSVGVATATDNCDGTVTPVPSRADARPLTDPFPVGTTTITWTATDSAGNSSSCEQTVTVTDNEKPTITCPANITANTEPGSCSANVNPGTATATDNCGNATVTGSRSDGQPLNAPYPKGTTTITWTARDDAGNSSSCTQTVTVNDNENPTITCPANITRNNDPGECGAVITYTAPSGSDNCPGATTTQTAGLPSGATFPVGTTTNTFEVTDASGNKSSCSFTVTVNDTENPAISCPANITANTDPGTCSANVNPGTATATDNCGPTTVSGSRSDGQSLSAPYPRGTTTITWTATDSHGNQATCTQTVTVVDNEAPTITTNGQTPMLWPANHQYHTFNVTDFVTGASDNCDTLSVSNVVIALVTSDEAENGPGSGNTFNDIVIAADCKSVQLRAERENVADGRVYTITFRVTDSSGNVGTKTSQVKVPKNLGVPVVDSGPHYAVTGTCP